MRMRHESSAIAATVNQQMQNATRYESCAASIRYIQTDNTHPVIKEAAAPSPLEMWVKTNGI
jgi:hypothetical protein